MRDYSGLERLETVLVAMGQGLTYPPTPAFAPGVLAGLEAVATQRPRWRLPLVPHPRLALAIAVTLALLACAAAVYYVSTKTWLSTGPRGIQFTSDFEFSEVFRDDTAYYPDFKLGPGGAEIYTLRMPLFTPYGEVLGEPWDRSKSTLVRLTGLDGAQLQEEVVLEFSELKDPALWDPGIDLTGAVIGILLYNSGDDLLAVAPNGDLFLVAGAWSPVKVVPEVPEEQREGYRREGLTDAEIDQLLARAPLLSASLIVLHPDGSRQKVLTVQELVEAGLLDLTRAGYTDDPSRKASLAVVAPAADRLWVKTETFLGAGNASSFYEIQDPNGDGDWSDRVVLPFALPPSLPTGGPLPEPNQPFEELWFVRQMATEPSLGGEERSRSFLLPALSVSGEYRIYRVSDFNSDGDALDGGEFELLFTGQPGFGDFRPPIIAPRVVVRDGEVVLRELVVGSLTRSTRVSRILESGEVIDIARAFDVGPGFEDLLAGTEGNIYVVGQLPGTSPTFVLYRLAPVAASEGAQPEATEAAPSTETAASTPVASPEPQAGATAITPGVPRIAFSIERYPPEGEETGEILLVGVDGSGPVQLVPGEHNYGFCQSADGSLMGFWSDEEVPHEPFIYVANADGSNPKKITEAQVAFWCNFPSNALPLVTQERGSALIRHDLASGEETTVVTGVDRLVASPDGRRFAFVSGLDFSNYPPAGAETLEVVDIDTGERRRLDGPLAEGRSYSGLVWSADRQRVAYFVGPTAYPQGPPAAGSFELYVRDISGGGARLMHEFEGGPPEAGEPRLKWSPDGRWLLLVVPGGGLLRIDVERGVVEEVATGEIVFAGWAPHEEGVFAYATPQALFLATVEGEVRQLATPPAEGLCPDCQTQGAPAGEWPWGNWMGWSPDGRYIGLGDFGPVIAVVDAATGEIRVLFKILNEAEDGFIFGYGWWR